MTEIRGGASKLSRKKLITLVTGAAAAAAIPRSLHPKEPTIEKLVVSAEDPKSMKERLEATFNISLQTVYDDTKNFKQEEINKLEKQYPDMQREWDSGRLAMLEKFLLHTPESFRKPIERIPRLRLVLAPPDAGMNPVYYAPEDTTYLNFRTFQPKAQREAFMDLIDSFGQRQLMNQRLEDFNTVNALLGEELDVHLDTLSRKLKPAMQSLKNIEGQVEKSSYGDLIERLNARSTPAKRDQHFQGFLRTFKGQKKAVGELVLSPNESEKAIFLLRMGEMIGQGDPQQFYGKMSAFYSQGREFFFRNMGQYMPVEKSQKIYDHLKNNVLQTEFKPWPQSVDN